MSKKVIPYELRVASWWANGKHCFYCDDPVPYRDLQIDHVIPESTKPARLAELITALALDPAFDLHGWANLVPTHHGCNKRKLDAEYPPQAIRFYIDEWAKKKPALDKELASLARQKANDALLKPLGTAVSKGQLSIDEITNFLASVENAATTTASEPLVVTFATVPGDLFEPNPLIEDTPAVRLEFNQELYRDLVANVRDKLGALVATTEDGFNGESYCVRLCVWNADIARIEKLAIEHWTITEVDRYSRIYPETKWDRFFAKSAIAEYHDLVRDHRSPAGVSMCPNCGNDKLHGRSIHDPEGDETYHLTKCKRCGWSD